MQLFELVAEYGEYIYFALISLLALVVTVYDKKISKRTSKKRVRESTLWIISLVGGSMSMYATMLFVRHKTKHKRFMIGIPVLMLVQAIFIFIITK